MFPLYLIDKQVSPSDVTFWSGLLGQGLSILGSIAGGYIITKLVNRSESFSYFAIYGSFKLVNVVKL